MQHSLCRAGDQRLDRMDWNDRPSSPKSVSRTTAKTEARVLSLRDRLKRSVLGEVGAVAIRRELLAASVSPCPAVRTIGRIFERNGLLDGRRRVRRPPPPKVWHIPQVVTCPSEMDCVDTIEGLAIRDGAHLTILTATSLLGGVPQAWPRVTLAATDVVSLLVEHWTTWGLPKFAQFDNDNRFVGPRQFKDAIGRVIRMCLNLGVTPVFAPPDEVGFQAAIESINGLWQAKVWQRFEHPNLKSLKNRSTVYIAALQQRRAVRISEAPARNPIPNNWKLNLQAKLHGGIIFIWRSSANGQVTVLGRTYPVDTKWTHRLVRAEVDLDLHVINFFALRRRQHDQQPLLATVPYVLPQKSFRE